MVELNGYICIFARIEGMIDGIGYICVFWSGDCRSEIFIRLGGFGGESEKGFDIDFSLLKQIVLTLNNRGIPSIY